MTNDTCCERTHRFFWMEKENDDYLMTLNLKSQNARYQKITNHVLESFGVFRERHNR